MKKTFSKKNESAFQMATNMAFAVFDTSSQSESLQRKADMANSAAQREEAPRPNNTGMPDNLKSGIESLSGFSMDDVRVHYNSSKPATVQALAYTQGTDIHVAPGQEKHLPHEARHVAQQMAGRVSPTTNINGMPVNDNAALEHEADVMGEKAVQRKGNSIKLVIPQKQPKIIQGNFYVKRKKGSYVWHPEDPNLQLYEKTSEYHGKTVKESLNDQNNDLITSLCETNSELILYYPVYIRNMHHVFYKETDFFNKHIKDDAEKVKDHKNANAELIKLGDNAKPINVNEYIIIVSHGSRPNFFFNSFFCGHSADSLASIVFKYLPRNYSGKIYLDGCHTAEPYKGLGDGTSFVERFGTALKSLLKTVENSHGQFKVKGNLGPAATGKSDGTEWIEEDKVNTSWIQQSFNERLKHKIKDDVAFNKLYNKYSSRILLDVLCPDWDNKCSKNIDTTTIWKNVCISLNSKNFEKDEAIEKALNIINLQKDSIMGCINKAFENDHNIDEILKYVKKNVQIDSGIKASLNFVYEMCKTNNDTEFLGELQCKNFKKLIINNILNCMCNAFETNIGKTYIKNWLQSDVEDGKESTFFIKVIRDSHKRISAEFAHKTYTFLY